MADTPVNQAIVTGSKILNGAFSISEQVAKTYINIQLPWTKIFPISVIVNIVLDTFMGKFQASANTLLADQIIDSQTNKENEDFQNAKTALQGAVTSGDNNAIQKASDDLDKAFDAAMHFDGN